MLTFDTLLHVPTRSLAVCAVAGPGKAAPTMSAAVVYVITLFMESLLGGVASRTSLRRHAARSHAVAKRLCVRSYLTRRHTVTVRPPASRPGLSSLSSSPVKVATRLTLGATWFGNELRSIFRLMVLSASLTV